MKTSQSSATNAGQKKLVYIKNNWQLYVFFALPAVLLTFIFNIYRWVVWQSRLKITTIDWAFLEATGFGLKTFSGFFPPLSFPG